MTKSDAELMRSLLHVVETSHAHTPPASNQDLDEDINRLRRVGAWFKGMFSKRHQGIADVLKGAAPLLKQFERYMGRKNQTYENLTWQTVVTFLASNATTTIPVGKSKGVPLNMNQMAELLNDPTFRTKLDQQMRTEKVALRNFNNWFPTGSNLSAKRTQPVGGPTPTNRERRSEIILHNVLEAAVSMMFDLVDGGEQEPAAAAAAAATPAPAPAPAPAPGGGGGAAGSASGTSPAFTAGDLTTLKALLRQLGARRARP